MNFAYSYFSQSLNRYQQAVTAYSRCLQLARKSQSNSELAHALNNLGILDSGQNRMEEARQDFAEALKIYRQLADKNPDVYLPDVPQDPNLTTLLLR